jgi:glycosyltransferase involved in cell wall biosynthesis
VSKLSVVIPSRNEQFLPHTIDDIFAKAKGDVQVIAILDGYWPDPPLDDTNPNLVIVHRGVPLGMRNAINAGVAIAKDSKYIMKCDAHCMFDEGFDEKLKADCDYDWVVVPRRYSLDPDLWEPRPKAPFNHMYLSYPNTPDDFGGAGYHGKVWKVRDRDPEYNKEPVFDLMSFQGSCWFMHRDYFYYLELMDQKNYGTFWQEAQEIGIKAFYSGGMVKRNTNTYYAHLHKGKKYGRGYLLDKRELRKPVRFTNEFIYKPEWDKLVAGRDLRWLVHHFWPVPGWPEEWAPDV